MLNTYTTNQSKANCIKNVLQFNITVRPLITEICSPLFTNLKFNSFGYTKVFNDGRRLILESNIDWLQRYSEYEFAESFDSSKSLLTNLKEAYKKTYHYLVLTGEPKNNIHRSLFELDLWNSMSLYIKNKDSIEVLHFSVPRANTEIINFYLNHFELLKRFGLFFKEKLSSILNDNTPCIKLLSSQDVNSIFGFQNITQEDIDNFIEQTKIKKVYIASHDVYLSKREGECLYYLCKGRSFKEIATIIKVSPRTVEQYLVCMKRKLNVTYKSDLIDIGNLNSLDDSILNTKLDNDNII